MRVAGGGEQGTGNGEQGADRTVGAGWVDSRWDLIALAAVVVGTVLRARQYVAGRSLWLDEAMLALNILGKSCRELFGVLSYDQAAPPLYLCLARATALPLGGSELGLRLPSLLAGIGALVLVWRVGRRLITPEAAAWAVWLLAISPLAIAYSNETKPYMLDALVAIVLVGLAWPVIVGEQRSRWTPWLAGVGMVALLASITAPFVLAGVGTVIFLDGAARRDPLAMRRAVGLSLLWLVIFLLLYFGIYRPVGSKEFLHAFWEGHFLGSGSEWRAQAVNAVTASLASLPIPDPLVRVRYQLPLAAVLGPLAVRLAGWRAGLLLMIPNGVVLVAAMARLHPLADRLLLFLAPATVLLCAAGLVGLTRWVIPRGPSVRGVILGLVVGCAAAAEWRSPSPGPGGARVARDVVHQVSNQAGPAPVLLVGDAVPTWLYYTTNWRSPITERLEWFQERPRYGSVTLAAIGVSPPDPALAAYRPSTAREGRIEMVASPSGAGLRREGRFTETFPTWGRDQATAVLALGVPVVWVPVGDPSEIDALAEGWLGLGGTVTRHEIAVGWTALELRTR